MKRAGKKKKGVFFFFFSLRRGFIIFSLLTSNLSPLSLSPSAAAACFWGFVMHPAFDSAGRFQAHLSRRRRKRHRERTPPGTHWPGVVAARPPNRVLRSLNTSLSLFFSRFFCAVNQTTNKLSSRGGS